MIRKSKKNSAKSEFVNFIVNNPGTSRAEIGKKMGINKATVSETVKSLIELNLIEETGEGVGKKSGGPKPIQLSLNYRGGMLLAIDCSPKMVSLELTYLDFEIVYESAIEVDINKSNVIDILKNVIDHCEGISKGLSKGIVGTTIAIHGVVSDNDIVFTPYYDIQEIDVHQELVNYYTFPITLLNEANLLAIAEYEINGGDNLIALSIHDGIGMGVITDSEPYLGDRGFSGEIGHTILYPLGRKCPCGNQGCFEQYCSDFAIIREYEKLTAKKNQTIKSIVDSYNNEDFAAKQILDDFCFNLAISINDIIMTFAPSGIYITSKVLSGIPFFIVTLKNMLDGKFNKNTPIYLSKLEGKGILLGGLVEARKKYIENIK